MCNDFTSTINIIFQIFDPRKCQTIYVINMLILSLLHFTCKRRTTVLNVKKNIKNVRTSNIIQRKNIAVPNKEASAVQM